MRDIKYHIIHCSDSAFGDVTEIRKWHKARGFRDIGYHFVIRRDGEVEMGRPINEIGAHCKGFNLESIGTCMVGKSDFTPAQFAALVEVHLMLESLFPHIQINAHYEFNSGKTCPNFNPHERLML